jgi:acetyl/propionyl-CoA carboxylase alpha subunit
LGLTSVSIYTPADRTSAHVKLANEAWLLPGPDQSAYIQADAVLDIAKKCGAHAIIPGYGEFATMYVANS